MLRPAVEGGFASANPRISLLAGPGALVAAEPDGIAVARFGWADLGTGRAANERTTPEQQIGFVLPVQGFHGRSWRHVYLANGSAWIRPGFGVTMCSRGDFWVRFALGAIAGNDVYASIVDGSAFSGYSAEAELTRWKVVQGCGPGGLGVISTWAVFPQLTF